ncbi:MAG: hypothetical protein LBB81_04525 [Treponema sp.]|jgi:hypothetical protein|nr:hypothetical protein [Treponema sp.]
MKYIYVLLIALVLSSCGSVSTKFKSEFPIDSHSRQIEIGSMEAQFDQALPFTKLQKDDVKVSYYPDEDLVCLQFRREFITYYQYWYRTGRQTFLNSLERYKTDYESRRLPKKNKSASEYGKVECFLVWETLNISSKGRSFPKVDIGYLLKDNSPYFTLSQMDAENVDISTQRDKEKNNRQILHFTRAQADDLALIFNQDNLNSLPLNAAKENNNSLLQNLKDLFK